MRIELNSQPDMKILSILKKIKSNPWVGILVSLSLIIPSLYKILDDIMVLRVEYLLLAIALPLYLKSLKKIFDEILDTSDDFSE
jgi:divalent metal cation (Fe/Co/Zn/Cd) transporter